MYQLRDTNNDLVGWLDEGRHVFDTNMNWVAYLSGGQAWSAEFGDWCGPVENGSCLDRDGRVVVWSPDISGPVGSSARPVIPARAARAARPARPARPTIPARPARPAVPVGGWSPLTFDEWLGQ